MTTTVGNTGAGASTYALPAKTIFVNQFTAGANVTVNRGFLKGDDAVAGAASAKSKLVIYSDNGSNVPSTLLGESDEHTGWATGTWIEYTFSTPVSLTSGTKYWIGYICDTGLYAWRDFDFGVKYYWSTYPQTGYPTIPSSWPGTFSTSIGQTYSLYVDDGGSPASTTQPCISVST